MALDIHKPCFCSTGICGHLTFGSGQLDEWGYWENPCRVCAERNERKRPEDGPCWPFAEGFDGFNHAGKFA